MHPLPRRPEGRPGRGRPRRPRRHRFDSTDVATSRLVVSLTPCPGATSPGRPADSGAPASPATPPCAPCRSASTAASVSSRSAVGRASLSSRSAPAQPRRCLGRGRSGSHIHPDGQANRPRPRRRPGAVPALSRGPCTHVTIGSILPPVTRSSGFFPCGWATPAVWPTPEAATPRDPRQSAKWAVGPRPFGLPTGGGARSHSGERAHGDAFAKPENFPESPVRMARGSALAPAGCGTSVPGEVHQTPRGALSVPGMTSRPASPCAGSNDATCGPRA